MLSGVRSSWRHVGQELALVLRSERELLGLFFQRLLGLLHFAVLAFHFGLLLGQQARLFLQLGVGLLQLLLLILEQFFGGLQRVRLLFQALVGLGQLLLLALQLFGQRLRLLQQFLGPHGRRDGVQHDADDSP